LNDFLVGSDTYQSYRNINGIPNVSAVDSTSQSQSQTQQLQQTNKTQPVFQSYLDLRSSSIQRIDPSVSSVDSGIDRERRKLSFTLLLKQSLARTSIVIDSLLKSITPKALLSGPLLLLTSMGKKKNAQSTHQQSATADATRQYMCSLFGAPLYGKGVAFNKRITADSFPSICTNTAVNAIKSIAMLLHLALEEDAKV